MSEEHFSQEKRILMAMRKTLAKIVRDLTPSDAALRYPLSDDTVEDVKKCFDLISARERELAQAAGIDIRDRPHFTDEPRTANVIPIQGLRSKD
ncbi:segregation and condensation protein A [Candidatus Thiothrix sp. Deng01]|uniref:Segregation and condensation protein A n=1 Tax=Candidatus Thiothrix phosphatis TaxID=3112415 RepID=A0ABU6D160_9GAMM|nr:segregation and condensation protein A [Candidatus Thiothrix sp. Deng01]MEB4592809.1 segregation and condensation protein A [Candidatus Thiothrix sp. Deng01]